MWPDFCHQLGVNIDYQILTDSFIHTALDNDMFMYIKELKKYYKIGRYLH